MKRIDGREPLELRDVEMKVGVIKNADGSGMVRFGKSQAIAAVYGPKELHPRHLQKFDRAVLRCVYSMAPFCTTERVKPGPSRRSTEISKVTRLALEPAIFLEEYPMTTIDVYILITQADAGTRTVGINAASLALADAGISMHDLVCAVAAGKINNEYVIDLNSEEEKITACDLPIAYMPMEKKITLIQMDGLLPKKDVENVIKVAINGCKALYEMQKKALKEKFVEDTIE